MVQGLVLVKELEKVCHLVLAMESEKEYHWGLSMANRLVLAMEFEKGYH